MKIKEIAFYDRPSERLIKYGAGVLSDYELLAIVTIYDLKLLSFEVANYYIHFLSIET